MRFTRLDVAVDETPHIDEPADALVSRLAQAKAAQGWAAVAGAVPRPVLGADTVVECDGRIMGKPQDRQDARAMIAQLSGRVHRVFSAVAIEWPSPGPGPGFSGVRLSTTEVRFRELSDREQRAYCDTDEPLDKAGGYAVQGIGSIFITRLNGSYSGVMGLPLLETAELLQTAGIEILDLSRGAYKRSRNV